MRIGERWTLSLSLCAAAALCLAPALSQPGPAPAPIRFQHSSIGFQLEHGEVKPRRVPATMAGGLAFGDFDGDGRIDAAVSALARPAELWWNRSPRAGHWLAFQLEGVRSNRDGIGAFIRVDTPDGPRFNHMTSSLGYASTSLGPVHFGLGPHAKAPKVEIRWPSGKIQILENVPAGQILKVREPD
jgi:hypothetical protein